MLTYATWMNLEDITLSEISLATKRENSIFHNSSQIHKDRNRNTEVVASS